MANGGGKITLLVVRHGETDCNVQGIIQGQLDTDLNSVGRKQAQFVGKALSHEDIDEVYTSPLRRAKDTADAILDVHSKWMKERNLSYWLDDRLKERGFGSLEGKPFDRSKPKRDSIDGIEPMAVFIARLRSFLEDVITKEAPFDNRPAADSLKSEWVDESVTRPAFTNDKADLNGIASHRATHRDTTHKRTILLVAHGAAISALVGSLLVDMNLAAIAAGIQRTRIWNCSITEVTVDLSKMPMNKGKVDLQPLLKSGTREAFIIERWADVRHLPDEIDDAVEAKGNVDEMVGKTTS